jgi:hypothetical protein
MNINIIAESMLVGIYTATIYLLFAQHFKTFYTRLLVGGFLKHWLGFFFGLWTWYCNYGVACVHTYTTRATICIFTLFAESIYESIAFLILGSFLSQILLLFHEIVIFATIGILLHIIGECIGVHQIFCDQKCSALSHKYYTDRI